MAQRNYFFSHSPSSLSESSFKKIISFVQSLKNVLSSTSFQKEVFANSSLPLPGVTPTGGLFLGLDFHDTAQGPKLIEINTNAGGLLLNALLLDVQNPCQGLSSFSNGLGNFSQTKEKIWDFFLWEWSLSFPHRTLKTLAVLDEKLESQFLFPEFLLYQSIFQERGLKCHILSPNQLEFHDNQLFFEGNRIDFIYNRHTDFYMETLDLKPVKLAWENGHVCLSPNPQDYHLIS